jgi:NAD+ synthase
MKTTAIISYITNWLKEYHINSRTEGFVVGVSGGIDSAVTSSLCAKTGLRTLCVEMPIHQHPDQVNRAKKHIEALQRNFANVERVEVDLTQTFEVFKKAVPNASNAPFLDLSLANTRARLRMTTLYYFAGLHRYLVAGTGNKVEDFGVGFYTKYGDGGVDVSPIADLMKSEVYALGKELNVIQEILTAAPTDGLFGDSRSDEDQLGASYDELEWAMMYNKSTEKALSKREEEVLAIYNQLHRANKHKMIPIPVCEIPQNLK